MSKRFGFWPHITHIIVLTFKEIKHLSDYRTVGLSDCRIIATAPSSIRLSPFALKFGLVCPILRMIPDIV